MGLMYVRISNTFRSRNLSPLYEVMSSASMVSSLLYTINFGEGTAIQFVLSRV